jgi:hypothetical protein
MKQLKVIVKKRFLDKYTGVWHNPGEVLTVTDRRYREINRKDNFIEVEKKPKVEKTENKVEIKK